MLTAKINKTKTITYGIIFFLIVAVIIFVLYRNFFIADSQPTDQAAGDLTDAAAAININNATDFDVSELDFVRSAAFVQLRSAGQPVTVGAERSADIFLPDAR